MSASHPHKARSLDQEVIHLSDKTRNKAFVLHWGWLLVLFMRVIGVVWLAHSLDHCLDIVLPAESIFETASSEEIPVLIVIFAIIDMIAGVGLWLASPWGGVLWIVTVTFEAVLTFILPALFSMPNLTLLLDLILVLLYFSLSWLAASEKDAR
jgi:hypothetical protein